MQRRRAAWGALLLIVLVFAPPARGEAKRRQATLAPGTRWEMPVWQIDSGRDGPTVVFVGGVHGDEPAGSLAAEQIARWPIERGRVVVIPRANQFALAANTRRLPHELPDAADLNRNFPRADEATATARGELAEILWQFLQNVHPDWVIDLHEGFDFHQINGESVGNSIIFVPRPQTEQLARKMLAAVNGAIEQPQRKFVPLRPPVDGSLARAAAAHLHCGAMILETTSSQDPAVRVQQHCVMARRFLSQLNMASDSDDELVDQELLGRTLTTLPVAVGAE